MARSPRASSPLLYGSIIVKYSLKTSESFVVNSPLRGATIASSRKRVFLIAVGRGIHESNLQENMWDQLIACR